MSVSLDLSQLVFHLGGELASTTKEGHPAAHLGHTLAHSRRLKRISEASLTILYVGLNSSARSRPAGAA